MVIKLVALCLLAFRSSAAHQRATHGQAPNEAFVDKLKALASQLGSNAAAKPTAEATSTPAVQAPPPVAAVPSTPAVQAPPPSEAAMQAPPPAESAPAGNAGFMKSLEGLKQMLGSKNSAAVATPVVAGATALSTSSGSQTGIEQQLNALKQLLHPVPSSNVVMVSNKTDAAPQPPQAPAASIAPGVVATSAVSTGKAKKEEEDDDDDDDDNVDNVVDKMIDSTHNAKNAALKPKAAAVAGVMTNAQRVAKMADQYISHVPAHTMLNKRRHHSEPVRP